MNQRSYRYVVSIHVCKRVLTSHTLRSHDGVCCVLCEYSYIIVVVAALPEQSLVGPRVVRRAAAAAATLVTRPPCASICRRLCYHTRGVIHRLCAAVREYVAVVVAAP